MNVSRACHAVTHGDVTPVVTVPRGSVPPTRPDPTHNYYGSMSLASHRYLGRLASAATAPGSDVACNAYGENPRWVL